MAADEFGGGMHHHVRSVFQRAEQVGRSKGVVHNEGNAVGVRHFRQSLDVRNVGIRVVQALHIQELGIFPDGLGKIVRIAAVHEGGFNAGFGKRIGKQVIGASVYVGGGNDVVSGARDVLDGVSDGSRSGGHGQRAYAPFQGSDALFKHICRGVHQAVVDISRFRQGKTGCRLFGILEDIGSGGVDRHGAGIRGRVRIFLAHVDLARFKAIILIHIFYIPIGKVGNR